MIQLNSEIHTWLGEIDGFGRVCLPKELRQFVDWTGHGTIVVESDGVSLRLMSVEQYAEELCSLIGDHATRIEDVSS